MEASEFIKGLFERASERGFEAYEAYLAEGEEFEINVFGGEIIGYGVSGSLGLSFRTLKGGKMGYASTEVLDAEAIDLLVEGAAANAELIDDADEQFIYGGGERAEPLDLYSERIDALGAAEKIEIALALEKAATTLDPRVEKVQHCMLLSMKGGKRIVNSRGVDVSFRDNGFGCYVSVVAREGDKVASGTDYVFSRNPSDIDVGAIARGAVREAVDGLTGKPLPSGPMRVALRCDAAASLLGAFASVFSADMAQKGMSLLKGREGEAIASPAVTLIDDPRSAAGLSSSPFDAEGVATRRRELVCEGVLKTLMHNLKTARKQGVETTGNASKGSYASPISVAPSNLYVKPSDTAPEALYEGIGEGLLITELQGLHSGANAISGDFSLGAKGYRIENGKLGGAVAQITVAGNFYELLKGVRAVGSDLRFGLPGGSCFGSPTIDAGELTVAGE